MEIKLEIYIGSNRFFFLLIYFLFIHVFICLKKVMIEIIKQEELNQNKVSSSLVSIYNCKMAYWLSIHKRRKFGCDNRPSVHPSTSAVASMRGYDVKCHTY